MAEMVLDCPYCNALKGFKFGGELPDNKSLEGPMWNTLFVCRTCQVGVVVRLRGPRFGAKPRACQGDPRDKGFKVLAVLPERPPRDIPRYLPEKIKREYEEAMECLLRHQDFAAAGRGFRKVLERATTALAAGHEVTFKKRENLKSRIDTLAGKNLITPAMCEWAHLIRDDGNDATHEENAVFTKDDAKQMREFTQLFLLCAFTLPESVKLARGTSTNTDQSA